MRKALTAIMAAAMVLSMAACNSTPSSSSQAAGGNNSGSTDSKADVAAVGDTKAEMRMIWWGSQTRQALTTKTLEKFQVLNPDIEALMDYSAWGG